MNLMEIIEVEPDEFLERQFSYPVFTQLKGADLYEHKDTKPYQREDFHQHPDQYRCKFLPYAKAADILMNGIYWDVDMPRLFEWEDLAANDFRISTISDITDDKGGSVPCNLVDTSILDPVYGVDKNTRQKTDPYQPGSIDIMA